LQSKTEHIFCVEYKILGSSVTAATAVEASASTIVMFLDARLILTLSLWVQFNFPS